MNYKFTQKIDCDSNELLNAVMETGDVSASGVKGQFRFNDTSVMPEYFDGTTWQNFSSSSVQYPADTAFVSSGFTTDASTHFYQTLAEALTASETSIILFSGDHILNANLSNGQKLTGSVNSVLQVEGQITLSDAVIDVPIIRGNGQSGGDSITIQGSVLLRCDELYNCNFQTSTGCYFAVNTHSYQNNYTDLLDGTQEIHAVDNFCRIASGMNGKDTNYWQMHGGRLYIDGLFCITGKSLSTPSVAGALQNEVIKVVNSTASQIYITLKDVQMHGAANTGRFIDEAVDTNYYLYLDLQNADIRGTSQNLIYNSASGTIQNILTTAGTLLSYLPNGVTANAWTYLAGTPTVSVSNIDFWQ